MENKLRYPVSFSIPEDLHSKLRQVSRETGRSLSHLTGIALELYVREYYLDPQTLRNLEDALDLSESPRKKRYRDE